MRWQAPLSEHSRSDRVRNHERWHFQSATGPGEDFGGWRRMYPFISTMISIRYQSTNNFFPNFTHFTACFKNNNNIYILAILENITTFPWPQIQISAWNVRDFWTAWVTTPLSWYVPSSWEVSTNRWPISSQPK